MWQQCVTWWPVYELKQTFILSPPIDYKTAETYKENKDKDTPKKLATEVTFRPKLATFEMDIMEKMNIKEDRVPKRTFWY